MLTFKWDEIQASPSTAEALKYGRRLSDKILVAFHHACDVRDIQTAEELLGTLDRLIKRPTSAEGHNPRKVGETLIDANYRLWELRQNKLSLSGPPAPRLWTHNQ